MKRLLLLLTVAAFGFVCMPSLVARDQSSAASPAPVSWVGDLSPITKADWNYDRAAHLLERAGLGGTPEEIEKLARMSPEEAVKYLVDYESISVSYLPPFQESGIYDPGIWPITSGCSVAEAIDIGLAKHEAIGIKVQKVEGTMWMQPIVQEAFYQAFADRFEAHRLAQSWAQRMLVTPRPLEEKITLFWHGHFATSSAKVRDYRMMKIHIDTLRKGATGSFRDLLIAMAKDPAMLVWLDNGQNVKGAANENFAREIMELFAMGVGNYSEKDIREAARAFTGWTNDHLQFVIKPELHDNGEKTVLGKTGNFDGADVIDIILAQKCTAEFMAGKLHRYFVRDTVEPELLTELSAHLRDGKYEMKPFLKMMFLSKDFYSPASYATQVKAPVHLLISSYRKLGLTEIPGMPDFRSVTNELGQELLFPPNVAGWEGGTTWINSATLLFRSNFPRQLFFTDLSSFDPPDRVLPPRYRGKRPTEAQKKEDLAKAKSVENTLVSKDYDLRDGVYWGYDKTFERVKPIPRTTARIDLAGMVKGAKAETVEQAVDHFLRRFLRVPLNSGDRQAMIAFLKQQIGGDKIDYERLDPFTLERSLRQLVHLIMCTSEYQVA